MFIYCNPNPAKRLVGDCVIRAISILKDQSWEKTYDEITAKGRDLYDMPSSNSVWDAYLKDSGYIKKVLPNMCPECYTVADFCWDRSYGEYLLATGTHAVAVINGNYYDTWDSGNESVMYYYERR